MAAPQFRFCGGDVLTTGNVPVDDVDAQALLGVFTDHVTAAWLAHEWDAAKVWLGVVAQLSDAVHERNRWRRASVAEAA